MTRAFTAPCVEPRQIDGRSTPGGGNSAQNADGGHLPYRPVGAATSSADTYATPDEFAGLDIGYAALKLICFLARAKQVEAPPTPWRSFPSSYIR